MSFLSSIGNLFKKLWKVIKSALDWVMDNLLAVVLIIAVVALVIYSGGTLVAAWSSFCSWTTTTLWPALGKFATWLGGFGIWELAAIAIGTGLLIDPEGTTQFLSETAGTVGELLGTTVGGIVGGIGSSIVSGSAGTLLIGAVAAYLGYKIYASRKPKSEPSFDNEVLE